MTVGENIKQCRLARGMTQADLAAALGVHVQTVGQWERGRRSPQRISLARIAQALDVDIASLTATGTTTVVQFNIECLNAVQLRMIESAAAGMTAEGIEVATRRFCEISQLPQYQTA